MGGEGRERGRERDDPGAILGSRMQRVEGLGFRVEITRSTEKPQPAAGVGFRVYLNPKHQKQSNPETGAKAQSGVARGPQSLKPKLNLS